MKTLFKVLGALVTVFLIAAIAVPFFVKVDRYRPEILKAVNERINGKLELGHLDLSLWGRIRIRIDGLKLTDASNRELVAVKDAHFHLPFLSILSGSPNLTLRLDSPAVRLVKNPDGKWNVLSLIKETKASGGAASAPGGQQAGASAKGDSSGGGMALPALVSRARFSLELEKALVTLEDRALGTKTELKDLDFRLMDVSLSRPLTFELSANLTASQAAAEGGKLTLEGPLATKGMFEPKFEGSELQAFRLESVVDLTALSIRKAGVLHKKPGTALRLEAKADGDLKEVRIEKVLFVLHKLELAANGKLERATERLTLDASTNDVPLASLGEVLEQGSELSGKMSLKARAEGPTSRLGVSGELKLEGVTYKAPMMKGPARIDAYVKAGMEEVESILLTVAAPGTDLKLTGNVKSMLAAPALSMKLSSSGIDLNQLLVLPEPKKGEAKPSDDGKAGAPASGQASSGGAPSGKKEEDLDASLDPLRKNERLAKMSASIDADIKSLKVRDLTITGLSAGLRMRDLALAIEGLRMGLWDGTVTGSFRTDLKPARPTYSFQAGIQGLDLKKAVESQMALFKNTLIGKLTLSAKGSGSSFVSKRAIPALNLQGNFRATDATFATIDVAKMVTEAVNGSIAKVAEKVPPLKGKTLNKSLPNSTSKYEVISSDFTMTGGVFRAPNFVGKAVANQGIDIQGSTTANLVTEDLEAKWKLLDTYDLTKAKGLSVDVMGQKVESVLLEKGKPLTLPVTVKCKMKAPCVDYDEAPAALAKVALGNLSGAAKSKVLSKETQQKVLEKAPEPVKNLLKKLPGGLFGN